MDPETGEEYFKGTRVETRRPKRYRREGLTRKRFLIDHPEVPKDWVEDLALMDAQRFTAEEMGTTRVLGGEEEPFAIRGRLSGIAGSARDLSETGGEPWLALGEDDRGRLWRGWGRDMEEMGRLEDKLSQRELEEDAVELYEEAVAELERALPVIRRLGLAEPPEGVLPAPPDRIDLAADPDPERAGDGSP